MSYADNYTDEMLEELEKKIGRVYSDAQKDFEKQSKEYFEKFAKRDEEYHKLVDEGKITEKEYQQWRLNQIGRGERLDKMAAQMAERATNANEVAVAYVNDATPSIYSLNRNHEAYIIEKLGYDMSVGGDFTLLNESSVRRLMVTDPDVMPYYPKERAIQRGIDLDYGQKYIKKHITSGILQGKSVYKIADDLQKDLTNMERASAIRTARTAVTSAQNGGRQDSMNAAAKMGIKLRKRWVSAKDMRVRDAHGKADGQTVNTDEPFIVGGEKMMFPGDTSSASGWNLYNCRCGMRTVEKEGIEAEQRQVRVRNPEWEKAHEDEEKAKARYERALEKEKAETDPEKKKQLRKQRLEKQQEYEHYSEIRKGTQKNIVVNGDMTYEEWTKLRGIKSKGKTVKSTAKTIKVDETPNVTKKPIDPYSFTDKQNEAIEWYVSGEGQFVNQYYRGRVDADFGELSDDEKALTKLLDEATGRELPIDTGKLYRSVDAEAIFGKMDDTDFYNLEGAVVYNNNDKFATSAKEKYLSKVKGKTITEKGYMSTTRSVDVAEEWGGFTGSEKPIVIEFDDVPKGLHGADLRKFDVEGDEQFEVLLARNTKYEITDVYGKNGQIHVKAKFVVDDMVEETAEIKTKAVTQKATIKKQYKTTEALNEYDYYLEEQESFRLSAIKEMSGADDETCEKYLNAMCGNRNSWVRSTNAGTEYEESWFYGADNKIRLAKDGEYYEKAKVIDDYIENSPKYEGSIYRGLSLDDDTISQFEKGATFKENGNLSSWTSEKDVASMFAEGRSEELGKKPVIFETSNHPHSTPTAHLSIYGSEESEVLVSNMKNNEYIVESVTKKDGFTYVKMKLKGVS